METWRKKQTQRQKNAQTTNTQWRHKSKKYENLGRCGRQNMLRPYLKIWEWELIFGRAVKVISSLGVRSPCFRFTLSQSDFRIQLLVVEIKYFPRMGLHHIKIKKQALLHFQKPLQEKLIHLCPNALPTYFHKAGQKLLGHTWEIGPKTQFVLHTVCIATYN